MPLIRQKLKIVRSDIQTNREWLFLFGDNYSRSGRGGQAAEMRGEPNSVGILTKMLPSMLPEAFLRDEDFWCWKNRAQADFNRVEGHLRIGGTSIMSDKGLGTGLAQLEERAPLIWAALQEEIKKWTAL